MRAIKWGFGIALVHRLLLAMWLAVVWGVVGVNLNGVKADFHTAGAQLPAITTTAEENIFAVWRRWDAVHYLDLAVNGYRVDHPGPTVFGVLTPLGIHAFDLVLPGSVDLAAMVFETLAFGLALTLMFKVGESYYGDEALGRWGVIVTALLPLSYFFQAPMSELIYLAMVLGVFYFGTRKQWWAAAICGALATLARSQGVLLLPVAGLLLLEQNGFRLSDLRTPSRWWPPIRQSMAQGWMLALIPVGFVGFEVYRNSLGLPPVNEVYLNYSYIYLTNPIDGLITNLSWIARFPGDALTNVDLMAFMIALALGLIALRFRRHRRLPLVAYTFGYMLVFVSKVNYFYGTHNVMFTQSLGRYTLVLFPLTFLIADGLLHARPIVRLLGVAVLVMGVLIFSALYVLALTGP